MRGNDGTPPPRRRSDDPGQGVEVHTGSVLSAEERQKLKQVFYDAETVFDSELRPLSDTILSSRCGQARCPGAQFSTGL